MAKKVVLLGIFLLLSVCFVLLSAFFGAKIESYEEFQNAKFGFPIPFITQDLSKSGADGYESGFPHRFRLQMDFLDNDPGFAFVNMNFLLSILIVYAVILALYFLLRKTCRS